MKTKPYLHCSYQHLNLTDLQVVPHMWFGGRKIDGKWYWIGHGGSRREITEFDWARYEPSGRGYQKNIAECINVYGAKR